MNCIHCQGAMQRGQAPLRIDRNGYHLAFDGVPAWVCTQCGEPYFEEREVAAIQGVVETLDERMAALGSAAA